MKTAYFIGIKGSGMSALAMMMLDLGYQVSGSDVDQYIFTQTPLLERGVSIYSFDRNNIKNFDLIIIGNAMSDDNPEVVAAYESNAKVYRYFEFLGTFFKQYPNSIGVAGSHGKTTTTGMVFAFLKPYFNAGYLIGDGHGLLQKETNALVIESCEFQDHFLSYFPEISVITNIDLDHIDYFKNLDNYIKSFQQFANQTRHTLVINGDDLNCQKINHANKITFGFNDNCNVAALNVVHGDNQTNFDLKINQLLISDVSVNFVADHNLYNLLAAIGVCVALDYNSEQILAHLNDYQGAARRFVVEEVNEYILIDDYAHHPTEIKVTIQACRDRFKNLPVTLVYKPDRVSRLDYFIKETKEAMLLADNPVITDFMASAFNENPNFDVVDFYAKLSPEIYHFEEDDTIAKKLYDFGPGVYLFVSTKDVYRIKNQLKDYILKNESIKA